MDQPTPAGLAIGLKVFFSKLPFGIVLAVMIFGFLGFNNGDLNHTVTSSYALLRGHVGDFYDFNAPVVVRNDYLPAVYLIFAAWMAPLEALHLTTIQDTFPRIMYEADGILRLSSLEFAWAKLLVAIAFTLTAWTLKSITTRVVVENDKIAASRRVLSAFVGSPFAIFAVFFISQYDIFGILFFVIGLNQLLKGRSYVFALLVGIAVSFKFIAVVPFIPILLIFEKRLHRQLGAGLLMLVPVFLQILLYWPSEVFRKSFFFQPAQNGTVFGTALGLPMVFCLVGVAFLSYKHVDGKFGLDKVQMAIIAGGSAVGFFLTAIFWHPQWLIWMAPFTALLVGISTRYKLVIVAESLAFIVYIYYVTNAFKNGIDVNLLQHGLFKDSFRHLHGNLSELYPGGMEPLFLIFQKGLTLAFAAATVVSIVAPTWGVRITNIDNFAVSMARALLLPVFFLLPLAIVLRT